MLLQVCAPGFQPFRPVRIGLFRISSCFRLAALCASSERISAARAACASAILAAEASRMEVETAFCISRSLVPVEEAAVATAIIVPSTTSDVLVKAYGKRWAQGAMFGFHKALEALLRAAPQTLACPTPRPPCLTHRNKVLLFPEALYFQRQIFQPGDLSAAQIKSFDFKVVPAAGTPEAALRSADWDGAGESAPSSAS